MAGDVWKSVWSVLHKRTTGPFFGAFAASWLVVNWKLVYVTIFVRTEHLYGCNKIEYIEMYNGGYPSLLGWPFASAVFFIFIFPFFTWTAYWATQKFKQWRINTRNSIQGATLITKDEQYELFKEIEEKDQKHNNLLIAKNNELERTRKQLSDAQKQLSETKKDSPEFVKVLSGKELAEAAKIDSGIKAPVFPANLKPEDDYYRPFAGAIMSSQVNKDHYRALVNWIQLGFTFASDDAPHVDIRNFYESNGFITRKPDVSDPVYEFTSEGRRLNQIVSIMLLDEKK